MGRNGIVAELVKGLGPTFCAGDVTVMEVVKATAKKRSPLNFQRLKPGLPVANASRRHRHTYVGGFVAP